MTPHSVTCPERALNHRYMVRMTAAHRRWRTRWRSCKVTVTRMRIRVACGRPATLWLVGSRGGIVGAYCAQHEHVGYVAHGHHEDRGATLRDADYTDRGTPEEVAMWAISRGPVVKPWYGPASRASSGGP